MKRFKCICEEFPCVLKIKYKATNAEALIWTPRNPGWMCAFFWRFSASNVLIDVLERNSSKKQKKLKNISMWFYEKFEIKGFIRPIFLFKYTDTKQELLMFEQLNFVWFSQARLHCFYGVLRFWPNLSQNVLINEIPIKKRVYN